MTVMMVPTDQRPWPSLGPLVCDFIEDNLVFGPRDLRGEPGFSPRTRPASGFTNSVASERLGSAAGWGSQEACGETRF